MRRTGHSVAEPVRVPLVVLHAASWLAVLAHGHAWVGNWMSAVDQVAGSVVIVGPVVSALTANAYARLHETSLPVLVVASSHPVPAWYSPAARLWLLATANMILLLGEVAVLVAAAGPPLSGRPLQVVPLCVLVLGCHVLVGMAIGLRLGPRLAGAVAGVVSFGLFLLAVAHLAPAMFVVGGATGDLVGERYRLPVLVTLTGAAVVTGASVTLLTGWSARRTGIRAGLAVTGVAAAMLLTSGDVVDVDPVYEPVPSGLVCRGSSPEVCVPADTPRALASTARDMHRLAGPLRAARVRMPTRWTAYWGQRFDRGTGVLSTRSGGLLGKRLHRTDLIDSLTTPAWCAAQYVEEEPEQALDIQLLLQNWIGFRNGLGLAYTSIPKSWFSSGASEAWVRVTYAKLRRCELAGLRFPAHVR